MDRKVAIITGANAGVGLSLADRLLGDSECIHVCMACRNKGRAEKARQELLDKHPGADVSIIIVDTSSTASVFAACKEIKHKFNRLDYLYLNAGIMTVSGVNIKRLLGLLTWECKNILNTGKGVIVHDKKVTSEGLQEVFATNLFGHYIMVRELEDHLGGPTTSIIVWTSSQNADKNAFDLNDIQHRQGEEPYSSSKYAMDLLSVALNDRLNKKGIYSVSTCPGLVISGMTNNILPPWLWTLVLPIFWLARLFVAGLTMSANRGAEALAWVRKQAPETLNPRIKYRSYCTVFGTAYVGEEKMHLDDADVKSLYTQMEDLYQQFKKKHLDGKSSNGVQCNGDTSNGVICNGDS